MSTRLCLIFLVGLTVAVAQPRVSAELNEDLFAATRKGDVVQVKALLDKGADVNARNRYGSTPLFFACDRGNLEVASLLIERGADLDVTDTFYNMSAIGWAHSKKNIAILTLLVEKGANPETPLMASIRGNDKATFDLVVEKGKPSAELLGEALYLAEQMKREPMAEALKAKGVKPAGISLSPEQLKAYTGKFSEQGGDAVVTIGIKDGSLEFSQPGFAMKLLALSGHRFKFVQQGVTMTFVESEKGFDTIRVPGRGGVSTFKRLPEESK